MNAIREPGTVGELMTHDPVLAIIDMSLVDAAELMDFYRVSGLPVIDWEGRLVGVISRSDLLQAWPTQAPSDPSPGLAVRELMTRPATTVKANDPIGEAARLMERLRIHRLVVIDAEDESPIGVVFLADLVHSMAERSAS